MSVSELSVHSKVIEITSAFKSYLYYQCIQRPLYYQCIPRTDKSDINQGMMYGMYDYENGIWIWNIYVFSSCLNATWENEVKWKSEMKGMSTKNINHTKTTNH